MSSEQDGRATENPATENVAAGFCATLVDEWVRQGLTDAVICPGSRSAPLAVALATHPGITVHVHHDERSAGFIAVGLGIALRRPAVVLTTSGTAAVELHPAVVEAHQSCVPMLVVTADRPPELQGVGSPQTIDQRELYGVAARWFCDPGPPDVRNRDRWRQVAADAMTATTGVVPGPVHLNLAFREPLLGRAGKLPEPDPATQRGSTPTWGVLDEQLGRLVDATTGKRGVVVAGARASRGDDDTRAIAELAEALGWPLVADHLSGCRSGDPGVVERLDALVRDPVTAEQLRPEVVIRIGGLLASRLANEWLDRSGAVQVGLDRWGQIPDPGHVLTHRVHADVAECCRSLTRFSVEPADASWRDLWTLAESTARTVHDAVLGARGEVTEPGAARASLAGVPVGGTLMVSSSMPVRDLEWYVSGRLDVDVVSNRGANGIDGVVSTAIGLALSGRPVVCLVGDIAFLHDTNALLGLPKRGVELAIVVVDNDGGGIFSFLPHADVVSPELFETLFGTPHGIQLEDLARAHGLNSTTVTTHVGLESALVGWRERPGPLVVVARSSRPTNVEVHEEMNAAVVAALSS